MANRDEQFEQWAKATWEKLLHAHESGAYIDVNESDDPAEGWFGVNEETGEWEPTGTPYLTILARAAFDLVVHTIVNVEADTMETPLVQLIAGIPDMAELPEETNE